MNSYKMEIPAVQADPDDFCMEYTEESWEAMLNRKARQNEELRARWAAIIAKPGFNTLQLVQYGDRALTAILHPSIRRGTDWQLSCFNWDGKAIGHLDFNNNEVESLCWHLQEYAWSGGTVEICCL